MAFLVELVSPERILFEGDAVMVVARTTGGDSAFLPGHVPYLGALEISKLRIMQEADGGPRFETVVAVHGGFVEVSGEGVKILSDVAELGADIDVVRARTAMEAAEAALRSDPENVEAKQALQRASVRLDAAGASASA